MALTRIAYGRLGALGASALASSLMIFAAWGAADFAVAQVAGPNIDHGREVYGYWCTPCHAAGPGNPGTQSLALKYGDATPAVLTEREDLTPEAVKLFVRQGVMSMAGFRKTEITDEDLDALAAYLVQAHAE